MFSTGTALLYCILSAAVVMLLLLCTAAPPPARLAVLPAIPATRAGGLTMTPSSPGSPDRHLCSSTNDGLGILQGGIKPEAI